MSSVLLENATKIAEGQNTSIFLSENGEYGHPVILKVLKEDFNYYPHTAQLQNEDDLIRKINIEGVRSSIALREESGQQILILDYFDGITLKQRLRKDPIEFTDKLKIAFRIASTLSQVHELNIIHRDLSANNILISEEFKVNIIDFGLATKVKMKQDVLVASEALEGTLPYISPEQTGRVNHPVDLRSDLYSFGIICYELFTGQLPFQYNDPMEMVHAHLAINPISPQEVHPEIPEILSKIILKLLSKNVESRYQSAFGVRNDLEKCLSQLDMKVAIKPFDLASKDQSGKFLLPSRLYGRENEIESLLSSFERSSNKKEVSIVEGRPGIGKTSLVFELYKPIAQQKGNFLFGKHEQLQKDQPYQAIAMAISGFVNYLLSETDENLQTWKEKILEAVGNEGKLLTDLIPNLDLIIGEQPSLAELGINERQNSFLYTFTKFIQCLAKKDHPLTLFIDDLQWADYASLHLIKNLVSNPDIKHFYFIGAYRDNEVDSTHPTVIVLNDLKNEVAINYIKLDPLNVTDLSQLLSDSFVSESSDYDNVAEIIFKKTGGNPFFINQFIQTIYEKEIVKFDHEKRFWNWDLDQLNQVSFTDNVVDFMIEKIKNLPPNLTEILQISSCIGDQFDLQTLELLLDKEAQLIHDDLWSLVADQYLVIKENKSELRGKKLTSIQARSSFIQYRFSHDRIRQAAYELIPSQLRQQTHTRLGKRLLDKLSDQKLHESIFDVVYQLNKGISDNLDQNEKLKIAELNNQAGVKAKLSSAYETAFVYFNEAKNLLQESSWSTDYKLTFEINLNIMESAYLLGNYDEMNAIANNMLTRTDKQVDIMRIKSIIIYSMIAQNKHLDLVEYGLSVLRSAGISLPKKPKDLHIIQALLKTKVLTLNKSIDDFARLPRAEDEKIKIAIMIMSSVSTGSYHNLPKLFPLVILKSIQLALKYGNTVTNISFYGGYGSILCGVTGEYQKGFEFGQLSLRLLDELEDTKQNRPTTNVIFGAFINHWKQALKTSIPYLQEAYLVAMETGDTQYAASAIFLESYTRFHIGSNLDELLPDLLAYEKTISRLNQDAYTLYLRIFLQGVINISKAGIKSPEILKGDIFDEEKFLGDAENELSKDKTALFHLHFNKAYINYHFKNYTKALEHIKKVEQYLDVVLSTYYIPLYHFYNALISLKCLQESLTGDDKALLKSVKRDIKKFKTWNVHSPENFKNKYELLYAEYARYNKNTKEASYYYNLSIQSGNDFGFVQETGLAHELNALFQENNKESAAAHESLKKAYAHYRKWGAIGKTSWLENNYPFLINEVVPDPMMSLSHSFSSRSVGNKLLDLSTILKASTTISSEIQLKLAIPKLLQIVIENAGAQSGVFIMVENRKHLIRAVGSLEHSPEMISPTPISDFKEIAHSVLKYVERTGENVVLEHALDHPEFGKDKHIVEQQVNSLLCVPILYQGKLLGIIYLENNLMKGAFTVQRLDLLTLLSGQIAITLHNAILYDNLEQLVDERTSQIEAQKEQLNLQNIELKNINDEKDYLVSLVSHDLRTPLYGIRSFAGLASRKVPDEKVKEFTEPIIETIDRLDDMITRILDISAINNRKIELNSEEFLLKDFIDQIVKDHQQIGSNKNVKLLIGKLDPHLKVNLDKNYFNQILDNLISNGIKYTYPDTSVHLNIEVSDKKIKVSVRDEGPGISKKEQRLLFNNFQRLSTTPTAGEKSTGLGLAIAKRYVEAMHGKIWCESEQGMGATFFIEINQNNHT